MKAEENIHISKYDNPKWVVISPDGMVNLDTLSFYKSVSIEQFTKIWDNNFTMSKWRNYRRKGYKCIKVEIEVKQQINKH